MKLGEEAQQQYPMDAADIVDLATASALGDGESFNVEVYVEKMFQKQSRPLGEGRTVPCQEILVRDEFQKKRLMYLMAEGTGSVCTNKHYVIKRGRVFGDQLQVWGYSMVAEIAEAFEVFGDREEL